jgi:hypothetical protein
MQGHAAIAVGHARKERSRKLLRQPIWAQDAALRFGKDRDRNGWVKPLVEEALMRRDVVEPDERLMGLFQLGRCVAQRKLVVVQASLNVEMRLHQIHVTFALGTDNGLMVNLQARTDRFELIGDIGSATIGNQGVGNPVAEAGGIQHRERRPARFRGGHGAG